MSKQQFLDGVIQVQHLPGGQICIYHCACYQPGADETVWRVLKLMVDRPCEACGGLVSKPPRKASPVQLDLWEE